MLRVGRGSWSAPVAVGTPTFPEFMSKTRVAIDAAGNIAFAPGETEKDDP